MLPVCVLTQDEILHEFQSQNYFTIEFLEVVGNGIGMPM